MYTIKRLIYTKYTSYKKKKMSLIWENGEVMTNAKATKCLCAFRWAYVPLYNRANVPWKARLKISELGHMGSVTTTQSCHHGATVNTERLGQRILRCNFTYKICVSQM